MTTIELAFHNTDSNSPCPYVAGQIPLSYECDGKEGWTRFRGYYRVENHPPPYPEDEGIRSHRYTEYLPQTLVMYYCKRDTEPVSQEEENGVIRMKFNVIEQELYQVEVYKIIDENKEKPYFFSDNEVTLYFRVLGTL
jgi:hypothetical protein